MGNVARWVLYLSSLGLALGVAVLGVGRSSAGAEIDSAGSSRQPEAAAEPRVLLTQPLEQIEVVCGPERCEVHSVSPPEPDESQPMTSPQRAWLLAPAAGALGTALDGVLETLLDPQAEARLACRELELSQSAECS